jgi:serine/threonine protein kinase
MGYLMTALERSALGSLTPLGSGGQGDVYRAPRAHINFAASAAFKEYKAVYRSQVDFGALEAMSSFLAGQTFAEGSRIVERVAWPISLVADQGRPVGFLMPEVPDSFAITLQLPSGAKKRDLAQFQHLLNPGTVLARRGITITERDRYLLLAHLAESMDLLHSHDVVVGDLSPKNVLFSLDPTPRCFFVDADAMRLAGRSALPQAETPDWDIRTVSSEELATKASDSYKLGLFVLRLLAGDQATRDPGALPAGVPSPIRSLLVRSLAVSSATRPSPSDWPTALRDAAARAGSSTVAAQGAGGSGGGSRSVISPAPAQTSPGQTPAPSPTYQWAPPSSQQGSTRLNPWLVGIAVVSVIAGIAFVGSNQKPSGPSATNANVGAPVIPSRYGGTGQGVTLVATAEPPESIRPSTVVVNRQVTSSIGTVSILTTIEVLPSGEMRFTFEVENNETSKSVEWRANDTEYITTGSGESVRPLSWGSQGAVYPVGDARYVDVHGHVVTIWELYPALADPTVPFTLHTDGQAFEGLTL